MTPLTALSSLPSAEVKHIHHSDEEDDFDDDDLLCPTNSRRVSMPGSSSSSPAEGSLLQTSTMLGIRPCTTEQTFITDSVQRKIDRKRANARLRQQRCRARKRARQHEEDDHPAPSFAVSSMSKSDNNNNNKPLETTSGEPILPAIPRPSVSTTTYRPNSRTIHSAVSNIELHSQTKGKNSKTAMVTPRYWQAPHPPPSAHPGHPLHHPKGPVPRVPIAPKETAATTSASSWKSHPQSVYSSAAPSYYTAYGMPWYPWPTAPIHQQQPYPYARAGAGMPHVHGAHGNTRLPPKLPPTSPLQAVSPPSTQRQKPLPMHHRTPEPTTANFENFLNSPGSDNLPPLWSTATKPTSMQALQSPWSSLQVSPPLFAATTPGAASGLPLYHALRSGSHHKDRHQTPTLPTTTPIKMSSEITQWMMP